MCVYECVHTGHSQWKEEENFVRGCREKLRCGPSSQKACRSDQQTMAPIQGQYVIAGLTAEGSPTSSASHLPNPDLDQKQGQAGISQSQSDSLTA